MELELSRIEKDVQRILEERARDLGRLPKQHARTPGASQELLILGVGDELFGVNIEYVQEIQILRGLTPVPGIPDFWAGLINLRGRLVPALDLRKYLELPVRGTAAYTKIVVITGSGLTVAMFVQEVKGSRRFATDAIRPPVREVLNHGVQVVTGITSDLISVLDLDALLGDPRLAVGAARP